MMSIHVERVPCPCPWCRLVGDQYSLHRVSRMWADDKPPSPEAQAMMDEIIKDAIANASRR